MTTDPDTPGPSSVGDSREATLTVYDSSGVVRLYREYDMYSFRPYGIGGDMYTSELNDVQNPFDSLGNIFLSYDPGRYPGTIVLEPTAGGFNDF